ncbi:MAG TPA: hypothetical protein VFN76_04270 [Candidatus Limnocylindria bacterium]|nr:hypothetical protein [Candidatus Limnocylindria bacterium]
MATQINEGDIVTELFVLGPQDVRVITLNRAMNYAVIQFRDLDKSANETNTRAVTLDKLQPKVS